MGFKPCLTTSLAAGIACVRSGELIRRHPTCRYEKLLRGRVPSRTIHTAYEIIA